MPAADPTRVVYLCASNQHLGAGFSRLAKMTVVQWFAEYHYILGAVIFVTNKYSCSQLTRFDLFSTCAPAEAKVVQEPCKILRQLGLASGRLQGATCSSIVLVANPMQVIVIFATIKKGPVSQKFCNLNTLH